MPDMREASFQSLAPAQAIELSQLVELEARWENMRKTPSQAPEAGASVQSLLGVQKAYESFRDRMVTYNKRYTPAHVPELLLNTPLRLAVWCRRMRELYLEVEHDPQVRCPVHLPEKAFRLAERMSVRMKKDRVSRSPTQGTIRAVIEDLEALACWCDDLAIVKAAS